MPATAIRRVFVAGTWSSIKAKSFAQPAFSIGRGLAERGFDLTTGPGTGISAEVIAGYKSVMPRGVLRVYLPTPEDMKNAGEQLTGEFDEVIQTDLDYPMRNVLHIKESDALIVITGGDGTLEESLPALIDYQIPTIVFRNSGQAAEGLLWLSTRLFPEWQKYLHFVTKADEALSILSSQQPNLSPIHDAP